MRTFKNKSFKKRDYETTNIVFCQAETAPDANWEECESSEITTMNTYQLWIENGVRYFGWL